MQNIKDGTIKIDNTNCIYSDERLKDNIKEHRNDEILNDINNMRICHYNYKNGENNQYGIIAQSINEDKFGGIVVHLPEGCNKDYEDLLAVRYEKLSAVAIEGIQALIRRNKILEERIKQIEEYEKMSFFKKLFYRFK